MREEKLDARSEILLTNVTLRRNLLRERCDRSLTMLQKLCQIVQKIKELK